MSRYPSRRVLGHTWVGWVNLLVVQWFFVRLAARVDAADPDTVQNWCLLGFMLPCTGWGGSDYVRVRDRAWVWP